MTDQFKLQKNQVGLLLLVWAATHTLLVWQYGIINSQEAQAYEGVARDWLAGRYEQIGIQFVFYAGYIALRVLQLALHLPDVAVYMVHLLLSLAAAYSFGALLYAYSRSANHATAAILLYITCPVIAVWNNFLYTDIIFCYLLTIGLYLLSQHDATLQNKIWFWVILLTIPFFRPVGFLFAATCLVFWLLMRSPVKAKAWIGASFVLLLALVGVPYVFDHAKDFYYPNHNAEANIICGLPSHLSTSISTPYNPQKGILHFFWSNPATSIRLFAWRLWKMICLTRAYYSFAHNAFLVAQMLLYYSLAVRGIWLLAKANRRLLLFILLALGIWLAPGLFFCADWANRFVVPAFVFILWLAAIGVSGQSLNRDAYQQ
jgi:hypothetical protein